MTNSIMILFSMEVNEGKRTPFWKQKSKELNPYDKELALARKCFQSLI